MERSKQGPCLLRGFLLNKQQHSKWLGCPGRPRTYLSFSSLVSSFWVCSSSCRSLALFSVAS